jgi:hypothetical protein
MDIQPERIAASYSMKRKKTTISLPGEPRRNEALRVEVQRGWLVSVGRVMALLFHILAASLVPAVSFAWDRADLDGKKSGVLFQEKAPLLWLERSIAECEKSINLVVRGAHKKCLQACQEKVASRDRAGEQARPGAAESLTEMKYSKELAKDFTANIEKLTRYERTISEAHKRLTDGTPEAEEEIPHEPGATVSQRVKELLSRVDALGIPEIPESHPEVFQLDRELDQHNKRLAELDSPTSKLTDRAKVARKGQIRRKIDQLLTTRHQKVTDLITLRDDSSKVRTSLKDALEKRYDGYNLTELAIMAGDREKIDELLEWEGLAGITSLKGRLIEAIGNQQRALAADLIRIGADVSQSPGRYSALALSNTFGQSEISATLARNSAWIETPWTTESILMGFHRDRVRERRIRALRSQLARIEGFSTEIREPHPASVEKIRLLKCRLECATSSPQTPMVESGIRQQPVIGPSALSDGASR